MPNLFVACHNQGDPIVNHYLLNQAQASSQQRLLGLVTAFLDNAASDE